MSAREVLVQVGGQRVRVWAEGDRLRYAAPKGALTPDLRGTLLRQKPGLLKLLGRGDAFLGMTLRQFEGTHCSLEVQVPGLGETVWFVSGPAEVERLRTEGVPKGRIWTARELRDLVTAPGVTHEDALSIARARMAFNAEMVDILPVESEAPLPKFPEESHGAEPIQASLDLVTPSTREFD